jgi:hypothetical protein
VVVLDHEHVRVPAQHGPQLARAAIVERRAERILRARGDDEPVHTARERLLDVARERPGVVDAHGHRGHAQRREQMEDRGEARVLDRHPIARRATRWHRSWRRRRSLS